MDFLNSNFFIGIVTLITGLAVWVVYKFEKSGQKVQAARVLLTEIRTAEERVGQIRDKITAENIRDLPIVLPIKSWKTYAPLFISDFDQDELNLLNSFYDYAELIEEFAKRNNDYFWITTEERARVTVQKIADFSAEAISNFPDNMAQDSYVETKRKQLSQLLDSQNVPYTPVKTIDGIKILLAKIPAVTTSSCGTRLKKLAKLN